MGARPEEMSGGTLRPPRDLEDEPWSAKSKPFHETKWRKSKSAHGEVLSKTVLTTPYVVRDRMTILL
jgi:hypothetical protein